MEIRVFGTGCASCVTMRSNVESAVAELGLDCTVLHVTRITEMMEAGVFSTPALSVDGRVLTSGRPLDVPALKTLLAEAAQGGDR